MRGLAQLERAGAETVVRGEAAARGGTWGGRQQVVFVLALAGIAAAGIAAYLAVTLPAAPPPMLPEISADSPLSDVYSVAADLKRGLDAPPPTPPPEETAALERREMMIWGIKIALAAGGCALFAIGAVLLSGRQRKR
jgi:hypothetical protein